MNIWDILILVMVAAAVVFSLRFMIRKRKNGGCGCGCGCAECGRDCGNRSAGNEEDKPGKEPGTGG